MSGEDDPTPVDGVRLDKALRDSMRVDPAMPEGKGLMIGSDGRAIGIDFGIGPDTTNIREIIAGAEIVDLTGTPPCFKVGGRWFTPGGKVSWRGSTWIIDGPDERTNRAGRPCVKLRGYRYAVDAKEIT